ncbi:MAG: hypothetical protein ABR587_02690 [Candidatus Binatia bacterium]
MTVAFGSSPASAVPITIFNADGFNEGFNDTTPAAPVGGNPGTTLGAQRLFLFQYAADAWALRLGGDVPVIVKAGFQSLGGDQFSATLGAARPTSLERDFPGAPKILTWYSAALNHQLAGEDRNNLTNSCDSGDLVGGKCAEILTRFNSDVDGTVLGSVDFYYGIDGNNGSDLDFLSVLLHEIAHGLGIISLIDPATGRISPDPDNDTCQTCSDAFSSNLENPSFNPKQVSMMTNQQRRQSILDDSKLVWFGPAVKAASGLLNTGKRGDGAVQIFAPSTYQPGSSTSHVDTDLSPNELMEPFITPPPKTLDFTLAMLEDMGWETVDVPKCGDANESKTITSADAHIILRASVGLVECPAHYCDVNLTRGVTSADALVILRRAVGQSVVLKCPLA